jgi:hypothetical protein
MPSVVKITEYWVGRCLKCDSTWRECQSSFEHSRYHMFCDSGEPNCARCQRFLGHTQHAIRHFHGQCRSCDLNTTEDLDCDCGKSPADCREYPRVRADRAHMVPHWVRGDNDVENIILLCHHCHRINPEPDNPVTGRRLYLDWLCSERDMLFYQLETFMLALKTVGHQPVLDAYDKDGAFHPAVMSLVRWVHPEPTVRDEELALYPIGTVRETANESPPPHEKSHEASS